MPTNSTRPPAATTSRTARSAAVEHRRRLLQVDDVDLVADAVQIRRHARVPAPRVVAEVDARFEELAQAEVWHRHDALSFPIVRLCLRGGSRRGAPDPKIGKGTPRVNYRRAFGAVGGADMAEDAAVGKRAGIMSREGVAFE